MSRIKRISVTLVVKVVILAMTIHEMQDLMMRKSWYTPENHNKKIIKLLILFKTK